MHLEKINFIIKISLDGLLREYEGGSYMPIDIVVGDI